MRRMMWEVEDKKNKEETEKENQRMNILSTTLGRRRSRGGRMLRTREAEEGGGT